jgi:hypothetical protein
MKQLCATCGRPTILAREIDGNPIRIDGHPVGDGEVAVAGDVDDQPTAFWNFDPLTDAAFWGVPASIPLYNKHRCAGTL